MTKILQGLAETARVPRGARKAEAKAPETFVETIKKDQKKRGLYAY